jgi:anaerobic magnesium-protoporphyrin IX monomethyl ester cyclase
MGCPYKCTFCSSPAQYKDIKKKYQPYATTDVVDHIEYVIKRFKATYIYFIDDDSFPNLKRVEDIIDEINRRKIVIRLGFRGARISEIKRMSDEYLNKLAAVGTNIMHIGAESGSQKILDLIKKDCTVEDIITVNKKLAKHPQIKTAYNWIVGLPGETIEDLKKTRDLIQRLIKDNPTVIIFIPNKFRPLPGTELYKMALEYGYAKPTKLEDWADVESEGHYRAPWYTDEQFRMIQMMQVASYFIDNKIEKVDVGNTLRFNVARVLAKVYSPIARFRFRYGITSLLFEYKIFNWFSSAFRL